MSANLNIRRVRQQLKFGCSGFVACGLAGKINYAEFHKFLLELDGSGLPDDEYRHAYSSLILEAPELRPIFEESAAMKVGQQTHSDQVSLQPAGGLHNNKGGSAAAPGRLL
jgi:hypothetical protein